MPLTVYCWRCRIDVPMLTEHEWPVLERYLVGFVERIQEHRLAHGTSLGEARDAVSCDALRVYRELTGFEETNYNALWHHRRSLYGPPCRECGKPLRTPRASYCPMCGTVRDRTAEAPDAYTP